MDRNEIVLLTQKFILEQIEIEDMFKAITDYCIEKGKDLLMSQQFVKILLLTGNLKEPLLTALKYFQEKFNICTITDVKGKLIKIF